MIDKKRVALMTLFGGRIPHPAIRFCALLLVVATLTVLLTGNKTIRYAALAVGGISIVSIVVLGRVLPYDECGDIVAAMNAASTADEVAQTMLYARIAGVVIIAVTVAFVAWAVLTHRVSPYALLYML